MEYVNLPSEYRQVEYISNNANGRAYLNLGFYATDTMTFHCKFALTGTPSGGYSLFGSINNTSNGYPGILIYPRDSKQENTVTWRFGNTIIEKTNTVLDQSLPHEIILSYRKLTLDGIQYSAVNPVSWSVMQYPLYLLSSNLVGSTYDRFFPAAVYYFKVYDNDTLVRNLIPCYRISDNKPGMYDLVGQQFYVNQGTGEFLIPPRLKMADLRRKILLNTPHIESVSGSGAVQFNTDMSVGLKEGKIYFSPVQEGTGTPSPDNVRPISGWDGIDLMVCGKNLLPPISDTTYWKNGFFDSNGIENTRVDYRQSKYLIPIKAGNYTLTHSSTYRWIGVYVCDKDGNKIYFKETQYQETITIPSDGYAKFYIYVTDGTYMIEKASTATTYEPYSGQTLTIPFPRTIYGGYVDLRRGVVVETLRGVVFSGSNTKFNRAYTTNGNIGGGWVYAVPQGNNGLNKKYCDKLPMTIYNPSLSTTLPILRVVNAGALYIIMYGWKTADYPDANTDAKKLALANEWLQENSLTFVYDLTYPISVNLADPPSIPKTIKGINNLWTNANGNVNISFWTH